METTFTEHMQSRAVVDKKRNALDWIQYIMNPKGDGRAHYNVAEELKEDTLRKIGIQVCEEYDQDKESRRDYDQLMEHAMPIAMQTFETKSEPWPGAANVKYPLITNAAIQFAARAYGAIMQGNEFVHCTVQGRDPDSKKQERALRVSAHMSYQFLYGIPGWVSEFDKLLHILPVTGICYRKTYWCPTEKRVRSDLILPDDLIIKYTEKSFDKCRRMSQVYKASSNEVMENIAAGLWLDIKLPETEEPDDSSYYMRENFEFIEQHRFLDLDGDGYEEPYIVTANLDTQQVTRIVPRFRWSGVQLAETNKLLRINPVQYFTQYGFIPSLDGSIYDIGYGRLLYPINAATNSVINQLIDAGTQANVTGGIMDPSVRMRGGAIKQRMGEWIKADTAGIDFRKSMFPWPTKEPSPTLFQLLGTMIEAGKDIGSIKDVLMGRAPGANVPATTVMAMVEQGLTQTSSIYSRVFRSLSSEFEKVYKLNSVYLDDDEYFRFLDTERKVGREDYAVEDLDVRPVADPTMVTEIQRQAKAQSIVQTLDQRPNINRDEVTRRVVQSLNVQEPEKLIIPPDQRQEPPPDPKIVVEQMRAQIEDSRYRLEVARFLMDKEKKLSEITKIQTEAIKNLAEAESKEIGPQLQAYIAEMKEIHNTERARIQAIAKQGEGTNGNTGSGGMASSSGNEGGNAAIQRLAGEGREPIGGGLNGLPGPGGPNSPGNGGGGRPYPGPGQVTEFIEGS